MRPCGFNWVRRHLCLRLRWTCVLTKVLGNLSELMGELDSATQAYERALSFNNLSVQAMLSISCILRSKDQFPAAVEYLRQILRIEHNNGEVWSSLGLYETPTYMITANISQGTVI